MYTPPPYTRRESTRRLPRGISAPTFYLLHIDICSCHLLLMPLLSIIQNMHFHINSFCLVTIGRACRSLCALPRRGARGKGV